MATAKLIESDGRDWYELSGTDFGTNYEFEGAIYGVTENDQILNVDGFPLTEGDFETIAVRNSIGI